MKVKVWRAQEHNPVIIDTDKIYEDSVKWVKEVKLNNQTRPLPIYVLRCQIDYSYAVEVGLASGCHNGIRANIWLYNSHNKEDDCKDGYKYLCKLAGPKRKKYTGVPDGEPPCTQKILQELGTERHLRAEIRKRLLDLGYEENTIRGAFKRLEKTNRVMFSTENHSLKNCEVWAVE